MSYRCLINVETTSYVSMTKELSLSNIACLQLATLLNMDSFTCSFQRLFLFSNRRSISKKNFPNFKKISICKSGKRQNVKYLVSKLKNIVVLKISYCLLFFVSFYD